MVRGRLAGGRPSSRPGAGLEWVPVGMPVPLAALLATSLSPCATCSLLLATAVGLVVARARSACGRAAAPLCAGGIAWPPDRADGLIAGDAAVRGPGGARSLGTDVAVGRRFGRPVARGP